MERAKVLRGLSLVLILFTCVAAFEDKESLSKRLNFYKDTKKYSNSTITVGYSPEKGLFCVANDYIEYGKITIRIPRNMSMCAYFIFPFKFELISFLQEIKELEETVGHQQKFSVYLLSYYLLYFSSDHKEDVKRYIRDNKLEQYYNTEEPDESLLDSFPKMLLNSAFIEREHYEILNQYGFMINKLKELEEVYNHVLNRVMNSEHMEAMLPWVSDFQKFKWAYSIVMSRGMTLRYNEYTILDNTKEKMKNYTKWDEVNNNINKYFSKNSGVPCLIPIIDLCNHYQPKFADGRDKRPIVLDTEYNHFINSAVKVYQRGEEVSYTYILEPSNIAMFLHYGFIIPNNIFDSVIINVKLDSNFSTDQLSLCKELGCDLSTRHPSNIPNVRETSLRYRQINQFLINYGRVKTLKGTFDHKKYVKILANDQPISYENEVSAWMYYGSICKDIFGGRYDLYEKTIYKAQKYRNKCKEIEENWLDEDKQRNEWMSNKTFENIYQISMYFQNIILKSIYGSYNKIIYHTQKELDSIRNKYLSE
jgi:hypothetical protein